MPHAPQPKPSPLSSLLRRLQKQPPVPAAAANINGAQLCRLILNHVTVPTHEQLLILADAANHHHQQRTGRPICDLGDRSAQALQLKLGRQTVHSRCRHLPLMSSGPLREAIEHTVELHRNQQA